MYVYSRMIIIDNFRISCTIYYFLLVYQQIPENFFQSNTEVFDARTRRSANYSDDITNGSIHNDLSEDSISSLPIESRMFNRLFSSLYFLFSFSFKNKFHWNSLISNSIFANIIYLSNCFIIR